MRFWAWVKGLFELPEGYDHATGLSREERHQIIRNMIDEWQRDPE